MSSPDIPSDQTVTPISRIFDVDETAPYDAQRTVQRYLSQATRHDLLQVVLGHPSHLVSVTEFDYYGKRSRSTISEQLTNLEDHEILARYHHEPNADHRDLPADFWGFTPFGIDLVAEFNYLRGLPIMRAAHDSTHKTATIRRHEDAPRPALPEEVSSALSYEESNEPAEASELTDLREQTFYADAAPGDASE